MSRMPMARPSVRRRPSSIATGYKNRLDEIEAAVNGFKIVTNYFHNSHAIREAKRGLRVLGPRVDAVFSSYTYSNPITCSDQGVLLQFDFKIYNNARFSPVLKKIHIIGTGKNSEVVFQRRRRYIGNPAENYVIKSNYLWIPQADVTTGVWKSTLL